MYKTFVMGNSITCTINCNRRIAATLFTKKILCFRYIILSTLYKGDNDDSDGEDSDVYVIFI